MPLRSNQSEDDNMNEDEFILKHLHQSTTEIALILNKKPELDRDFIINQINGIQKAKKKLPEFYQNKQIVYPAPLSMEQCSSEETAIYKSLLVTGNTLIDLTGGFGIDSYYFSKKFKQVTYLEPNTSLFNTASKNFKLLAANNINSNNTSTEEFLIQKHEKFDVAYIDPSRRDKKKRIYLLDESIPNIIELSNQIFNIANQILVKTAPLLDIKHSLKELGKVSHVFVIAVNNECKEVLYLLDKNKSSPPLIHTINLGNNMQEFSFSYLEEQNTSINYSVPQRFLYEPNAAILKAGAFNAIADKFNINKIGPNSHLYTSEKLTEGFPGRTFRIEHVVNYNLKEFKKLGITKANVTCRNFKVKPDEVKKKIKVKDGGSSYIFASTDLNAKPILICCVKSIFLDTT